MTIVKSTKITLSDNTASGTANGELVRNGALLEYHDGTSSRVLVGRDTTDTLTNKTINTSDNTITVASADVTGLSSSLADKAPIANPTFTGTVAIPNIANLETTVTSKAPLASPTFTGDVTTASSVLKNQGIAGMSGVTITTPTSNSIGHVVVAPSGTGTRGQITTSNSSDPSTNGELLAIGSDIYTTNEHAIRTHATGSGTARPLAVYFDTTKVMQITDATGIDINGNNIDNVQNVIHDISAMSGTAINFNNDQVETMGFSANLTLTTSNRATGRSKTLKMSNTSGSTVDLTFPAWKFVGAKPTDIAGNKIAILTVTCFGTADTDIVAAYAVEA